MPGPYKKAPSKIIPKPTAKKNVDPRKATSGYVAPMAPPKPKTTSRTAGPEELVKDLQKIDNAKKKSVGLLYRIFGS